MKKILVISGKGGTGKTTITSTLVDLLQIKAVADCDVDAPNLHLISNLNEESLEEDLFEGMKLFKIDKDKCTSCGKCEELCKFSSVIKKDNVYWIDPLLCEGCAVCQYFCPADAISSYTNHVGVTQVFKGEDLFSTAQLHMGSGNSGKLVSQVKKNLDDNITTQTLQLIDGSPGIGCPVIASLSAIDLAIIVTEPSLSGLSDLKRILKIARIFKTKAAIIINKADLNDEIYSKLLDYIEKEKLPFLGKIGYDKNVSRIINSNKSLATSDTQAAKDIIDISKKLVAEIDKI